MLGHVHFVMLKVCLVSPRDIDGLNLSVAKLGREIINDGLAKACRVNDIKDVLPSGPLGQLPVHFLKVAYDVRISHAQGEPFNLSRYKVVLSPDDAALILA